MHLGSRESKFKQIQSSNPTNKMVWLQMNDLYAVKYLLSSAVVKKYKRQKEFVFLCVCPNSNFSMLKYHRLVCLCVCVCECKPFALNLQYGQIE